MSDGDERLARIETHLEYIRRSLEAWDERCAGHRLEIDERIAPVVQAKDTALVLSKLLGVVACVLGILKVLGHV